ncbi:MAG: DUF4232 domain-containing protein [Acidimicrobiales bacterium]|jgi:hypothetical protein
MSTPWRRIVGVGLIAVTAASCGNGRSASTTTGPARKAPPTRTSTTTVTTTTTTLPPATTTTTVPSTACGTGQVALSASPASGAGGHLALVMVFSNHSATACTMDGYPAAWFVGTGGSQIGPTSVPEYGTPAPTTVLVQPGGRASSTLWYDNPGVVYPPCPMTTATGLRVVPPGQSEALGVTVSIPTCTTGTRVATTPVTTGTAETPF